MKLSIEAELVYNFVGDTQAIANLEASRTSDQIILSESLDIVAAGQIFFRYHALRRSEYSGFPFRRRDHPVFRLGREQPPTVASPIRPATCVVGAPE
jgi:hypothetical protein